MQIIFEHLILKAYFSAFPFCVTISRTKLKVDIYTGTSQFHFDTLNRKIIKQEHNYDILFLQLFGSQKCMSSLKQA